MTRDVTARGTGARDAQAADVWAAEVLDRTRGALEPLADPTAAVPMAAYMKHVAPFLGAKSETRRRAQRGAWLGLADPVGDNLGRAARALVAQPEREYHYAAADLVARFLRAAGDTFLDDHVESLLLATPWWDTVDGLGTAAVSPLCRRAPDHARPVIERWSGSGERWLIRAAIQHQRGWKGATDVPYVLHLCDAHAGSTEFFVVKAIGWALRDLAPLDARAVRTFLQGHPTLGTVAVREARRGLDRL